MKWIRRRVLAGEVLAGTFLNLGSSLTAEIAGHAGFDWLLLDLEHGAGDRQELLAQLQAIESTPAAPLVRVGWNDPVTIKRVLDLGPSGVMVPLVKSAQEASLAASAVLYPPRGIRGVAASHRAALFGARFEEYFARASDELVLAVQVESVEAVANATAIAAVGRVDVLFLGPLDLSVSMGRPRDFDHPEFRSAAAQVVAAARQAGKAAGVLATSVPLAERYLAEGFTFVACGSDGAAVSQGLRDYARAIAARRSSTPA
jgi:4-hydroxy-2-oxoheptanedioate aldolase